jgi:UPF0755 protein
VTIRSTLRRLLVAVLLGTVALGSFWTWALYRVGPPHPTEVTVPEGASLASALEGLQARGLVPSPLAMRLYLVARGRARGVRFGVYRFPPKMRPLEAVGRLLAGKVETVTVTLPEGATASEIGERFAAAGVGTLRDWEVVRARAGLIHDFAPQAATLEGFLFPDTYSVPTGTSAERAARLMVQRFHEIWGEELKSPRRLWATPLEVVVLASMIEAETSLVEERRRIAGVFVNRLRLGMLLQCDSTVVYALKRRGLWPGRLLRAHWQLDDPYNTYRSPGLPPGPIGCPGRASLAAALDPERHGFLYFVAKPGGGHVFSTSLDEHNRAVAELQRARR